MTLVRRDLGGRLCCEAEPRGRGVPTRSMGTRGHGNEEMSEKGMSPNMLPCGTCPLVSFSLIEDANLHETIVIIESPQGGTSQLYFPCSSLQLLVLGLKFSSQTNRSRSDVLLSSHLAVRVRWFHGHVADQFTQRKWDNGPTRLSSRRQKDTGEASATPPPTLRMRSGSLLSGRSSIVRMGVSFRCSEAGNAGTFECLVKIVLSWT
jgi:hypothetical protein